MGAVTVRVIDARISVRLDGGATRYGHYRLVTTLLDEKQYPADELVELYHQRWEIETSYLELKSTILADECCARVPRRHHPRGLRTADHLPGPAHRPGRYRTGPSRHRPRPAEPHRRPEHRPRPSHSRRRNDRRRHHRPDRLHRSRRPQPAATSAAITLESPSGQTRHFQAPG
ncbi:transposase [Mycolicibacterium alvei]|uniref:transposase n=1 Tax=Mycolicibacterium alvei TaxID=67081 RepID=UPI003899174F